MEKDRKREKGRPKDIKGEKTGIFRGVEDAELPRKRQEHDEHPDQFAEGDDWDDIWHPGHPDNYGDH